MKKPLSFFTFIVFALVASAQQPTVCVITNTGSTGTACSPSSLGSINPCATIPFIVTNYLPPPAGYAIVGKFEWFV